MLSDEPAPALERVDEIRQRFARLAAQFFGLDDLAGGAEQRHAAVAGEAVDAFDAGVAQAALRNVDNAFELEVVRRVVRHPEIGQRVLHFGALIKARAADDAIGQPGRDEAVFEGAHLERGADEDRDLVQSMAGRALLLDDPYNRACLFLVVPHAHDGDFVAALAVGEERLAEAALVGGDEARGGRQNVARRAVVPLQAHDLGTGEIVFETQDVVHLGAAPAVDRLIVIADAADVRRALGQQAQPQVLDDVCVLILVDQDVAETAMVVGEDVRMLEEQAQRFEQEIAEVGRVEFLEALLVGGIKMRALARRRRQSFRRPAPCPVSARGSSSCR